MRTVVFVMLAAACSGFAQDAAFFDISNPPATIDSNTTFDPQVVVKNNGSEPLSNIPLSFSIVRSSDPSDTIYRGTANSGPIGADSELVVDFVGANITPDVDFFTLTGITELPGDTYPWNDTLALPLFVRYADVAVEITSPRDTEPPGLVPFTVRLTNLGNLPAAVPRLDVTTVPSNYADFRENIPIGVGESTMVTANPWFYDGGTETCMAWITYPEDENHHNDTDIVTVNAAGILERAEMEPHNGMSLALSPSPLAGNLLRVEYSLTQAGPARVTVFDVSGAAVTGQRFVGARRGGLPLYLRALKGGVYLVRLDDGRSVVTRKLVVQR